MTCGKCLLLFKDGNVQCLSILLCFAVKPVSESNEEFEGPFKPAKALKQGSVLDILKGPGKTTLVFEIVGFGVLV